MIRKTTSTKVGDGNLVSLLQREGCSFLEYSTMFVNSPSHRAQQSLDVVYTVTIFVRCCWLLLGLENRRRNFQRSFKGSATDRNSTTPCFSESSSKKRKRETNNDSKLSSIFHDCNCERNCVSETWVKPKPKHDLRLLANLIGWENNASSLIGRAILKSQSEDEPKPKSNQFLNYFRQSSENRSKPYVLIGSFYRTSFL